MGVVPAFTSITGTGNAGMVAYYRAPGCDEVTIADVLPILSKIDYYEDEYVIGEMLIWDTGSQSAEPNNCAMVRVIVYNDGWICAWFDKTTQNQLALSSATYVSAQILSGWGTSLEYENRYNSYQLKITGTDDPSIPIDTIFTIRNTDHVNGRIQIHDNQATGYAFHSGYTYDTEIYTSNGNMLWWGYQVGSNDIVPTNNTNRLYRAIYQIWEQAKTSSNSTNWSPTNASLVYMYDSQTDVYTNETTDFNDVGADDCQVLPTAEVINDAFYIGLSNKFSGITITMGTPGVGSAVTWEYWDGSTWSTLLVVDGSVGFTSTGELTFDPPDDWATTYVNSNSYYWVRARVTTASYTTTPLLTQGQLYSQNSIGYTESELGVYNYEFTSANYCMIAGVGTEFYANRYWYYTILPSKTIYTSDLNIGVNAPLSNYLGYTYLNGIKIHVGYSSGKGYININLTDIDYSPGIQNCIRDYENITYGAFIRTAVVVLVS